MSPVSLPTYGDQAHYRRPPLNSQRWSFTASSTRSGESVEAASYGDRKFHRWFIAFALGCERWFFSAHYGGDGVVQATIVVVFLAVLQVAKVVFYFFVGDGGNGWGLGVNGDAGGGGWVVVSTARWWSTVVWWCGVVYCYVLVVVLLIVGDGSGAVATARCNSDCDQLFWLLYDQVLVVD
ncbi:Hypothetical predicted protein [Olea europaea subsp. europaea]|uniref:Transmembrane protein n=1 Tax=Olea europaea subsp. europaea TaxID=158383 RepID=A0A8S0VIQ7_OLEEU|nr:Hypothetical predicted protein [Olea europaea subsp. europaea]